MNSASAASPTARFGPIPRIPSNERPRRSGARTPRYSENRKQVQMVTLYPSPAASGSNHADRRHIPMTPCAISACCRLEYAEPVDPVECRDFVTFREGRVIEYRVDEVVDFPTKRQHRLTDVDQLARPFANDVDTEQLAALAVKNQL